MPYCCKSPVSYTHLDVYKRQIYQSKVMSADRALELIQDGDYIFSAQAAGEPIEIMSHLQHLKAVSYTHLDVYKRQPTESVRSWRSISFRRLM